MSYGSHHTRRLRWCVVVAVLCALVLSLAPLVSQASGDDASSDAGKPEYTTLKDLEGKNIAYINGSVYDKKVEAKVDGTTSHFYASLADCVAAVENHKEDAAVQLSYCCQLVVNRKGGSVALLPENVDAVDEAFFFPKGDPLVNQFNEVIDKLEADGTIDELTKKWVAADDSGKTLPAQDWDAPNGTLKFATSGVLEPYSYVGADGEILGYDVDLALRIAKELGYHLEVSTITMDAIFASVESGKVDFGGTLTNTEERAKKVDFTHKVMPSYVSVIVRTEGGAAKKGGFIEYISDSFYSTFIEENRWQLLLNGLIVTITISVCSGILGTILGFGTVLARRSGAKWPEKLVKGYQALMGGIPLVVVLMVLYYVVFGKLHIAGEIVAIVGFTLGFGATSGATMWTAVNGVDVIQEETGLALGYTRRQVFSKIIFPQAAQQFLPQLMGQFVSLVKETSIVGFIAVQDLTRASDLIRSRTMDAFFPLISTAIIYFLFCRLLAFGLDRLAKKLDPVNNPCEFEEADK